MFRVSFKIKYKSMYKNNREWNNLLKHSHFWFDIKLSISAGISEVGPVDLFSSPVEGNYKFVLHRHRYIEEQREKGFTKRKQRERFTKREGREF